MERRTFLKGILGAAAAAFAPGEAKSIIPSVASYEHVPLAQCRKDGLYIVAANVLVAHEHDYNTHAHFITSIMHNGKPTARYEGIVPTNIKTLHQVVVALRCARGDTLDLQTEINGVIRDGLIQEAEFMISHHLENCEIRVGGKLL